MSHEKHIHLDKGWLKTMVGQERNLLVGFIDQGRFSDGTRGFAPQKMFEYVGPFLESIMDLVISHGGWIDKLFGDEVMFEFMDWQEREKGWLKPFIQEAREIVKSKVPSGKARMTFSFGPCVFVQFNVHQYSEVNIFGTPVNVAKRLQGVPGLIDPEDLGTAIGVVDNRVKGAQSSALQLADTLEYLTGDDYYGYDWPSYEAKGVGRLFYRDNAR